MGIPWFRSESVMLHCVKMTARSDFSLCSALDLLPAKLQYNMQIFGIVWTVNTSIHVSSRSRASISFGSLNDPCTNIKDNKEIHENYIFQPIHRFKTKLYVSSICYYTLAGCILWKVFKVSIIHSESVNIIVFRVQVISQVASTHGFVK